MKKILSPFFLYATCLGLFVGCHSSEEKKEEVVSTSVMTGTSEPPTPVSLVTTGKLSSTVKIPGELQAFQQVDLYAKVSSYVRQLYADVGTQVSQGQLMASLDAPEIASQLAEAQSKLRSYEAIYIASKASYNRLYETSKTPGTISPNDLDLANAKQKSDFAQWQAAKAAYSQISSTSSYLQVRAPFAGVVTARNVNQGAYVGPAGKGSDVPMFVLQTQKKLRLVVSVPEAYTSYLSNKNEISFTVASLPNQTFKAQIKRLAGALDQRFHSERIEMDVINDDKKLLPGMVAEIIIPLPAKNNTLIVPTTAILNGTEKVAVIKVSGGKAHWVEVDKGRSSDKQSEVFGALQAGDTIVTTGSEEIRDGMPVQKTIMSKE